MTTALKKNQDSTKEKDIDELKDAIIQLEAKLVEQEHRLIPTWYNFFSKRAKWKSSDPNDPRIKAAWIAALFRLFPSSTVLAIGAGVIGGLFTFAVLVWQGYLVMQQNQIMRKQNNYFQTQIYQDREKSWRERRTELISKLYSATTASKEAIESWNGVGIKPLLIPSESARERSEAVKELLSLYKSPPSPPVLISSKMDCNIFTRTISYLLPLDCEDNQTLADTLTKNRLNFNKSTIPKLNLSKSLLQGTDLSNLTFDGRIDLRGANMSRANLDGIQFKDIDLSKANFSWSSLKKSSLEKVTLSNSNLAHANMSFSTIKDSKFLDSTFTLASLYGTKVDNTIFSDLKMLGVDFMQLKITDSIFKRTHMQLSDFTGTYCSGCFIFQTTFHGARFYQSTFKNSLLMNTHSYGAIDTDSVSFHSSYNGATDTSLTPDYGIQFEQVWRNLVWENGKRRTKGLLLDYTKIKTWDYWLSKLEAHKNNYDENPYNSLYSAAIRARNNKKLILDKKALKSFPLHDTDKLMHEYLNFFHQKACDSLTSGKFLYRDPETFYETMENYLTFENENEKIKSTWMKVSKKIGIPKC